MEQTWNPVGWFEIPVNDMARAKAFYEHVLQTTLEEHVVENHQMAWFPMKDANKGAGGSLVQGEGCIPADKGVLIYFTAPDIEAALSRALEKNGTVLVGKTSIGPYGYFAFILDTEGNRIGLHSRE